MAQTDNSFLTDKIFIRVNHLPDKKEIYVLDCFAGKGKIWKNVVSLVDKKIKRLPIEFKDGVGFHLPGNNMAWMGTIDLTKFDVIDLDAYGVPYEQLKAVFESGYSGAVFVTFIQSLFGVMPRGLMESVGVSGKMLEKCPTLFYKSGWEYFLDWLYQNGVRQIVHRPHARKHYLYFNCAGLCTEDCNTHSEGRAVNRA